MITFNNIGRHGLFGNQLFQYSTLYSIAKNKNYDFGVPYRNTGDVQFLHFFLPNCFLNLTAKDSSDIFPNKQAQEKNFSYDSSMFDIEDGTDICGYFQSEKYFKNHRISLLKEFTFKPEIVEKANNIRTKINQDVISLHIRLGDYLKQQNNHPVCSIDYYEKALKKLPDNTVIFIFSDDEELASSIFSKLNYKFVFPKTNNKYVDMCLMAMCDYHIIANSSFSWWGAWLSNSKQTIAPEKWFGPAQHMPKNWSDIYCENWLVL